jgi:hypothetical protein
MGLLTQTSIFSSTQPLGGSPSVFDLGPSSTFQEGDGLLSSSLDINNGAHPGTFPVYMHNYALGTSNLDTNSSNHHNGLFDQGPSSTLQQDSLTNGSTSLDDITIPEPNVSSPLAAEETETISQIINGDSEDINTSITDLNIISSDQSLAPDTSTPPPFDLGRDSTLQQDSLLSIPTTSPYQDLDGLDQGQGYFHGRNNPGKGQGKQVLSKDLHVHLLEKSYTYNHGETSENVGPSPGPTGNSEYQDLDGVDNGQGIFTIGHKQGKKLGKVDLHEALLTQAYSYKHGDSSITILGGKQRGNVGGTPGGKHDLNGRDQGQGYFHGVANPTAEQGKQLGGVDLHKAMLTTHYNYRHGNSTTFAPTLQDSNTSKSGGIYDLDGNDGTCYRHPETNFSYC